MIGLAPVAAASQIHHDLKVRLHPQKQRLQVTDQIKITADTNPVFLLHDGLNPRSLTPGVVLEQQERLPGPIPIASYQISMPKEQQSVTLVYEGEIVHERTRHQESPGLYREELSGTISADGIYLDAGSAWYPYFPDTMQTFSMEITLPSGWLAISQGDGPEIETQAQETRIRWQESTPQDNIHLVAGTYRIYRQSVGDYEAQIYLMEENKPLADRYLTATARYLRLYEQLIGAYPYTKFALVENFWDTGYAMPSFTLLGPRVIRLPFIIHTSYPHEILHNWWGNSVYIDYASGNWAEGLTSYLADHLLDEQRGLGAYHRRRILQRYQDFIRKENDFPLNQFRGRHNSASQAVGYGKAMMVFHMLRRELGDSQFLDGLRLFYSKNRFNTARYHDLQEAFETVSQRSLQRFFKVWTHRTGAPILMLQDIHIDPTERGYRIQGKLRQTQKAPLFPMNVPVVIHFDHKKPVLHRVDMSEREVTLRFDCDDKPQQLDIDPWFDLFRSLYPEEIPPTLSQLFGNEQILFLLPSRAPKRQQQAYLALAQDWSKGYPEAKIRMDHEVDPLPKDRPVWLLGWENQHLAGFFDDLEPYPVTPGPTAIAFDDMIYSRSEHSFALTSRHRTEGQTLAWIAGHSSENIAKLARKLPHYGGYSYLAFIGKSTDNILKGQWPVTTSPLRIPLGSNRELIHAAEPAPLTHSLQ
jgi:aminopeptidase N